MEACGKRAAFSKARWTRSVRPRCRQRPQGSAPRVTHPASALRQWLRQNNPPVSEANSGMLLKTILNRIQKHRGFVYGPTRLCEEGATLRLEVESTRTCATGRAARGVGAAAPRRHAPHAVVRVRAALGPPRLLPVSDAPSRLRALRRGARRAGALGRGKTQADDHVRVVLGAVGEASELAGGGAATFGARKRVFVAAWPS